MEDSDKLSKRKLWVPLVTWEKASGRKTLNIHLPYVIAAASLLMIILSYVSLIFACKGEFSCKKCMPSLNYIMMFSGYDRLVIASSLFWFVALVLFAWMMA
jgi:hypothetical protein